MRRSRAGKKPIINLCSVMDSVVLWAPSTCTNEPTGEDLCARHVSGGDSVWDLIGQGFLRGYNWIVLDVARQMAVLSVLPYSCGCCILRHSLVAHSNCCECRLPSVCVLGLLVSTAFRVLVGLCC